MKKYYCYVDCKSIIKAETKEQAEEIFMENHDMEDLIPVCKEYRKRRKNNARKTD